MVLFNIAKKNIEKNLKGYFLYFFSIVFTVGIYYAFKNLQYNPSIDAALSGSAKASTAFNAASIVIAIFSVLFIWYSNSFFIKKRKKEIGLYALLGIENKEIGLLLFFETVIIGVVALIIGTVAGILFSKIMLSVLIKLIGLNLSISFAVSFKGVFETFILFILIFLVIAYQSNRIIYKFKLIELFKASSISEKSQKGSKLLALLSVIFILSGYGIYLSTLNGTDLILGAFGTLFMVVLGTFLFFGSFMYFVIRRQKSNGANYYKGLNMISTSQLLYRIKSNAKMLATIAILSATTLTAIGVSISVYFMTSQMVDKTAPYSYTLKIDNKDYIKEFEKSLSDSKNHDLIDKSIFTYLTIKSSQKNDYGYEEEYEIISISNLNQILKLNGDKEIESIKDDEFIHVYPKEAKEYLGKSSININNDGKEINLKLKSDLDKKLYNGYGQDTIVVSDNVFENLKSNNEVKDYYTYNITNKKDGGEFENTVKKLTEKYAVDDYKKTVNTLYLSYYSEFKDGFTTSGIMVFIGVFVGLVFLVCTGSVIFFKLLSEAQDEAPRYNILKKIGVDEKDIKSSVYKQVGFNFFLPLIIGSIHSIVANYVVCKMLSQNLGIVMMWTLIPYSIIYIAYYLITSKVYFNIVTKQN
ncbi:ABC transporter permease [Paraclostridium ghonii]|uniref:ABC transporter permease n=1 Tax=Paraclostridium ghonii TaxID=29358 RepID=UPI00202CB5AA|nr:ABC transporter permease [Paeniclostridium ghonii]MCM0165739.1 ABC transporter permease [Paeniclostridium ghonii]